MRLFVFTVLLFASFAALADDNDIFKDLMDKLHEIEVRLEEVEHKLEQALQAKEINNTKNKELVANKPVKSPASSLVNLRSENDILLNNKRVAEREDYDEAILAIREKRIAEAENKLAIFLKDFPDSYLISNAHYWLGEICFSRKDYVSASSHFLDAYQIKPSGSKAPDSILKVALSLEHMGNISGACAALIKLQDEFPSAHPEIKSSVKVGMAKLRCDND